MPAGIQTIFSVRDEAAQSFMRPFVSPSHGLAIRSFTDEVNRSDPGNPMFNYPKDFALYALGDFDEDTGIVTALDVPALVVRASAVMVKPAA